MLLALLKIAIVASIIAASVLALLKRSIASAGASLCANAFLLAHAASLLGTASAPVLVVALAFACVCIALCIVFRDKIDPVVPSLAIGIGSLVLVAGYVCAGEEANPCYAASSACGCIAVLLSRPLKCCVSRLALIKSRAIAIGAALIVVSFALAALTFFFRGGDYGIAATLEVGSLSILASPIQVVLLLSGVTILYGRIPPIYLYMLSVVTVYLMARHGAGPTICLLLALLPLVRRMGGPIVFVVFLVMGLVAFLASCLPYLEYMSANNAALIPDSDGSTLRMTIGGRAIMDAGLLGQPTGEIASAPSPQSGYALASVAQAFGWVGLGAVVATTVVVLVLLGRKARTAVAASYVTYAAVVAVLGLGCFATVYVYSPLFAGTWEMTIGQFLIAGVLSLRVGEFPSERETSGISSLVGDPS